MASRPVRRLPVTAFVIGAVLLLSCALFASGSSRDDAAVTGDAGELTESISATETPPSEPTGQPASSSAPCEAPPPDEIPLGSPVQSSVGESDPFRCYWVQVPDALTAVSFELGGLSADLSLFVGHGYHLNFLNHIGDFWSSNEVGTADESVVLDNPQAGRYFIKIGPAGLAEFSQFAFTVRTEPEVTAPITGAELPDPNTCDRPAEIIKLGSSVTSEITAREERPLGRLYYCVQAPGGLGAISIELSATGNLDLLVHKDVAAEWYDRGRGPDSQVVIDDPAPGAYYIEVAPQSTGETSEFTLSVQPR